MWNLIKNDNEAMEFSTHQNATPLPGHSLTILVLELALLGHQEPRHSRANSGCGERLMAPGHDY